MGRAPICIEHLEDDTLNDGVGVGIREHSLGDLSLAEIRGCRGLPEPDALAHETWLAPALPAPRKKLLIYVK